MKKNNIIIYILLLIYILLILNPSITINTIKDMSYIYFIKIFPNMFPSMVIGSILIKQNVNKIIPGFLITFFNKICNFSNINTTIFIMSLLTGAPSYALYINDYYNNKIITEKEALGLLHTCFFINPLFVISAVGTIMFNSIKLGLLLYILLVAKNIIKIIILKNEFNSVNISIIDNKEPITVSLITSIKSAITASLNIYGIIIFFNIIINILTNIFSISPIINIIISSTLEITTGIIKLVNTNIPIIYKFIISFLMLNFGGICIHIQTISIIKNKKIRYIKYLINRII